MSLKVMKNRYNKYLNKVHGHPAVSRVACSQSGSCISPTVKRKQTYKHQGLRVHTWKEAHPVSIEINVAFSGERNGQKSYFYSS